MARKSNVKRVEPRKANLKVVKDNEVKTTAYNDINLRKWKEYDHVKTDTLWEFSSRLKDGGHSNEYHGNFIPQIAQQLYERYTKTISYLTYSLVPVHQVLKLSIWAGAVSV